MAKRLIDSGLFNKGLVRSLKGADKLLWVYLITNCDNAGIWDVWIEDAELKTGFKYKESEILKSFAGKIIPFDGGRKWFIPSFIEFQYNSLKLSESNNAHNSAIKILRRYNLIDENNEVIISPSEAPPPDPHRGAIDIDKDKDLDMDKDKDKRQGLKNSDEIYLNAIPDSWDKEKFLVLLKKWIKNRKKKPDQDLVLLRLEELVEKYPTWFIAEKRMTEAASEGWYKFVYADKEDLKKKSNQNGTHDPSSSATFHFDTPAEALKRR
jgi:hypothetical protein